LIFIKLPAKILNKILINHGDIYFCFTLCNYQSWLLISYLNHGNTDCAQGRFHQIDFLLTNGIMRAISLYFWSPNLYVCLFSPGAVAALRPFAAYRIYCGIEYARPSMADARSPAYLESWVSKLFLLCRKFIVNTDCRSVNQETWF